MLIGCSRHNAPGRPHAVTDLIKSSRASGDITILLVNDHPEETAFSTACAVARAFPTYTFKKNPSVDPHVTVFFNHSFDSFQSRIPFNLTTITHLASSIQQCQSLIG